MKIFNILVLLTYIITIVSGIKITLVGYIFVANDGLSSIQDKFNEYAKNNNLDIELETKFYTYRNCTAEIRGISYFLEYLIEHKENSHYDMYLLDSIYSGKYSDHFVDLETILSEDIIKPYRDGIATKTSIVKNKLVSLPLYVDYGGLYYNVDLLNKYNKTVPKTWDELIETYNFIYNKETEEGIKIEKFCGFPVGEAGVASTLEMIHSFRNSWNDKFPDYLSDEAIEALEKMKEVKEKTSDNESFNIKQEELWQSIYKDRLNYIFFRAWYSDDIRLGPDRHNKTVNLNFAPLPGHKAGVSGSCIGGSNIALSKYVSKEKKRAAIEIYRYLFSYEFQKHLILNASKRSAIHSTYLDDTVCQKISCGMYSNMQGVVRPSNSIEDYPKFSEKFYNYVKEYLIDEKYTSAREALKKIEDLSAVYYVEYNSITGIVLLSIIIFEIILILCSYIYVSIKRLRKQFNFVPFNYWCCFLLGNFLLMCYCLTVLGNFRDYTCALGTLFITLGFTLTYIPFFIKLSSIFPRKNCFINFINKDHSRTLILFILSDAILNLIWILFDPVKAQKYTIEEGESFKICNSNGKTGNIIIVIIMIKGFLILSTMIYYIMAEWDSVLFKSDISNIGYSIYFNIFNYIIYIIVNFVNIKVRYVYYGFRSGIVIVFCIFNLGVIILPKFYEISIYKEKYYSEPNINKFIEKTRAFDDNFKKELDFINLEDLVKCGLMKDNNNGNYDNHQHKHKHNHNNNEYYKQYNDHNRNYNYNYNNYASTSSGYRSDSTVYSMKSSSRTHTNPLVTVNSINSLNRNMYDKNDSKNSYNGYSSMSRIL